MFLLNKSIKSLISELRTEQMNKEYQLFHTETNYTKKVDSVNLGDMYYF